MNPEQRVVNGLLKAGVSLHAIQSGLTRSIAIQVPPARLSMNDLWPCLWALVIVLERQFLGTIFVKGASGPLNAPRSFGDRVVFADEFPDDAILITLGVPERGSIFGNAGESSISIDPGTQVEGRANPLSGFALAGYVGFAALATAVGVPPFRLAYARPSIPIPPPTHIPLPPAIALIGLGQLGQAYLALMYFLREAIGWNPRLHVIDRDTFRNENQPTQILYDDCANGESKSEFLNRRLYEMGFETTGRHSDINWDWRRLPHEPRIALLGLDNMEARRILLHSDFDRLIVGGIGASFTRPRVSWHDLPSDKQFGSLFQDQEAREPIADRVDPQVRRDLEQTHAGCGWLVFDQITASAPSMGLLAAASVLGRLFASTDPTITAGGALLWSQLLPHWRERLN